MCSSSCCCCRIRPRSETNLFGHFGFASWSAGVHITHFTFGKKNHFSRFLLILFPFAYFAYLYYYYHCTELHAVVVVVVLPSVWMISTKNANERWEQRPKKMRHRFSGSKTRSRERKKIKFRDIFCVPPQISAHHACEEANILLTHSPLLNSEVNPGFWTRREYLMLNAKKLRTQNPFLLPPKNTDRLRLLSN